MLSREQIEYTLRESGYITSTYDAQSGYPNRFRFAWNKLECYDLGRVYIHSGGFHIPYSDLTPEKWERYTGLKFHEKGKGKREND